jgi:molybdopterin biosynthesis enzyme
MTSDTGNSQRIARLTPLADVLARVDGATHAVAPRALAPIAAVGRVLAADVTVSAHPMAPLALRDGWAVTSDLTIDASAYAPVPLAGAAPIAVGETMPAGADAVAPPDLIDARSNPVNILGPVTEGDNVLPAGGDIDAGGLVLGQGRRLTRLQASVLAAVTHGSVLVREPRIRVVGATDDAVIGAAVDLVVGAIEAIGGRARTSGSAGMEQLDAALADDDVDAVVALGGTGSGPADASVHMLARHGRVEAHGIALAPGETTAFGVVQQRPVLLLPGRIDAALAGWLVIGRPLVLRLEGAGDDETTTDAVLTRKVTSGLGLAELVPVRLRDGNAEPIASGYVSWTALSQSDGWLLVPAESEGYPAGTRVVIRPWP